MFKSEYLNRVYAEVEQAEICPFAVMLNMADAVLSASAEKNISSSERGRVRADYIRRNLPVLDASEAVSS